MEVTPEKRRRANKRSNRELEEEDQKLVDLSQDVDDDDDEDIDEADPSYDLKFDDVKDLDDDEVAITATATATTTVTMKPRPLLKRRKKPVYYKDDSDNEDEKPVVHDGQPPIPVDFKVRKKFSDGEWYNGKVVSKPEKVKGGQCVWKVLYEDGDSEDLNRREIMAVAVDKLEVDKPVHVQDKDKGGEEDSDVGEQNMNMKASFKQWTGYKSHYNNYDDIMKDLVTLIGISQEEVEAALAQMKPPYGTNKAIQLIHKAKKDPNNYQHVNRDKFKPHIGMKVRKYYGGNQYIGTVTNDGEELVTEEDGKKITCWKVEWDDGDFEDMDFEELLTCQADRPTRPHPVRGRQLNSWEIFSGCGIVTQEFAQRRWRVRSMDSDPMSNATDKLDIMNIRFEDIDMVPDFIWASPPCFTYSNMAGGAHRQPAKDQYEISAAARENNRYLVRLIYILKWAIKKHPHLIVCIENPVGLLQKMPLMQMLIKELNLKETMVHYCAFGREDMKPTYIWTNDFTLHATLSEFKCKDRCPYGQIGAIHPLGARLHGYKYNAAAIPQPLAEEVAQHVDSEFYRRRIRYTKEAVMTEEEVEEFNEALWDPTKVTTESNESVEADAAAEDATAETEAATETDGSAETSAAAQIDGNLGMAVAADAETA